MELYSFRSVSFSYPEQIHAALNALTFSVMQGEFLIICGPSGCGKSTLLRHLKSCMTPHGMHTGEICFRKEPLTAVSDRIQTQKIGFVLQSPENQIVTDKVWHELAFGLESLGYDSPIIRRRVAETASFFGIETWFHKSVSELSGGQKQLLSLAAVMAMQPDVLILDEPTAQLDPIAASDFLALLGKINRELGTTVILTEHRLEEAFPFATRIMVMEHGHIICDDLPANTGMQLKERGNSMFLAMPTAMRVWAALNTKLDCPVTVRDGSRFLSERSKEYPLLSLPFHRDPVLSEEIVLQADDLWFRYEKDSPDIIKGFSLALKRGEFFALLGGNGAGKTTALKILSNQRNSYRGHLMTTGKIGHLPQNPQTLFVKRTVREDLYEIFHGQNISKKHQDSQVAWVVSLCDLSDFLDRHPYDISGGEQQRAALAKVLLTTPDILLLDEPTKGFDAEFKETFASILRKLTAQGISILMVSHDVAFCAEHVHRCGLFFDGHIVTEDEPRAFFSGNRFYTTPANRMARHMIPLAITVNDIVACCGGTVASTAEEIPEISRPLPSPRPEAVTFCPPPLPIWRKLLAVLSLAAALGVFLHATSMADLSALISSSGISTAGYHELTQYGLLIGSLMIFLFAVGRRSAPPILQQTLKQQRKLSKRTLTASALILLCIPLTLFISVVYLGSSYYYLTSLLILLESMLPFLLIFEDRKPKPRELITIAVLCAIGVAGRSMFFMLPQFKPVMALTIIAGVAFGGESGFFVGAMTMLASNVLFSQGPWTPWQMFSMGIIGFLSGILFRKGLLRRNRLSLAIFGFVSSIVIYGGIMNPASALMWSSSSINPQMILAYYISGLPMDLVHGAATFFFLMVASEPMLEKLDRIKVKYGLAE